MSSGTCSSPPIHNIRCLPFVMEPGQTAMATTRLGGAAVALPPPFLQRGRPCLSLVSKGAPPRSVCVAGLLALAWDHCMWRLKLCAPFLCRTRLVHLSLHSQGAPLPSVCLRCLPACLRLAGITVTVPETARGNASTSQGGCPPDLKPWAHLGVGSGGRCWHPSMQCAQSPCLKLPPRLRAAGKLRVISQMGGHEDGYRITGDKAS
jgi:hypothetical protein